MLEYNTNDDNEAERIKNGDTVFYKKKYLVQPRPLVTEKETLMVKEGN